MCACDDAFVCSRCQDTPDDPAYLDAGEPDNFQPLRKSRSRTGKSKVNSGKEKRRRNTASFGFHKSSHAKGKKNRHL